MGDLIIKGFAVFYIVAAYMDLREWIYIHLPGDQKTADKLWALSDVKPFNCPLCMSFWLAIPVFFLPSPFDVILAIAGVALLLHSFKKKLEIFTI